MSEKAPKASRKPASGYTWKHVSGRSTFWNVRERDVLHPIIEPSRPTVVELPEGIVTPRSISAKIQGPKEGRLRYARGAVYDRDRALLPVFMERERFEASANKGNRLKNDPVLADADLAGARRLDGRHVFFGILRPHFGHFLLESLSRAWHALADPGCGIIVQGLDPNTKMPGYMRHMLELLEIDPARIVTADRPLIVETLLFPQSEFEIRWKARPSYGETFAEIHARNARIAGAAPPPRSIYLTRRQLAVRTPGDRKKFVRNEAAIEAAFVERGFEIVAPEKLPLQEQIAMIGSATRIAGLKGSALHMSLFAQRPDAQLIQIDRAPSMNQCLIDSLKGMEAHHIYCESPASETGSDVDLEMLRAALDEIEPRD